MNTKEKEPATVGAAASSAESSACQIDSVNSIHDNSQKVNIPDYIADALKDRVKVGIHMWQLTGNVRYKKQADKIKSWL